MRRLAAVTVVIGLVAAGVGLLRYRMTPVLDDFEGVLRLNTWTVELGHPGDGVSGRFARTPLAAHSGHFGGEMAFDFSRGGRYVAANMPTRLRGSMGGLAFWVRATAGVLLAVRVRDGEGQVFQKEIGFAPRDWTPMRVTFEEWTDSWGGRNDGIMRGSPRAIALVAANTAPQRSGTVYIDDLRKLPDRLVEHMWSEALPPHPRLMLSLEELRLRRAVIRRTPWLRSVLQHHAEQVREAVSTGISIPPEGGQCEHWYACPDHGASLEMVAPRRHVCPVDGKVFSGWPYDQVWVTKQHKRLARLARQAAVVFALSDDPVALRVARTVVAGYARRYRSYPLHDIHGRPGRGGKVLSQSLDDAAWLVPILQAADLVWHELSDAERRSVQVGLVSPAVAEVIRPARLRFHNIQCWHNAAVGLSGFLTGDRELIAEAIEGTRGFEAQVRNMVDQDGQWSEGSWGYHFYALEALATLAEAARVCGRDLFPAYLRPMFASPLRAAMPDGTLPRFNDDSGTDLSRVDAYEIACARLNDASFAEPLRRSRRDSLRTLLYGAPNLPPSTTLGAGPRVMTDSGYAILAPRGSTSAYVCLKFGRHGGDHGHYDKNGLVVYGGGSVVFDDPGVGPYLNALADGWYKTSAAHNTATISGRCQSAALGALVGFAEFPDGSGAMADAGYAVDGMRYRRAVFMIGAEAVVVLDMLSALDGEPRTVDVLWHPPGIIARRQSGTPMMPSSGPGYRYMTGLRSSPLGPATASLPYRTEQDGPRRWLTLLGNAPGARLILGSGPGRNTCDRRPVAIVRQRSASTAVLTVLTLQPTDKPPNARLLPLQDSQGRRLATGDACAAEVRVGSGRWLAAANPGGRPVACPGWSGTDVLALTRLSGKSGTR
ncbi:MAG: hypothetical protein GX446_17395 [Chthonomonadales bacterium]|nr:hypothetical protein [Chthonomonadales bacterium]